MSNKCYRMADLMAMEACTGCRICADTCPAVTADNDGTLSGLYRLEMLKKLVRSRSSLMRLFSRKGEISGDALKKFSDTVFRCTLCGNCQEVCPSGIGLKDLWLSLREDMVDSEAYPEKNDMIRSNLLDSHNIFDEDNDERADWVEDLRDMPENGFQKETAEIVYFTGCVASYFPMAQKIPMALTHIFEVAGVDFTILGEDEWCCGYPALGAGLGDEVFNAFVAHNMEAVRKKGAKKVVFSCPSCYDMWLAHYPAEFELLHATEFLDELIQSHRIPLKNTPLTVTYHDPCDLGRAAHVYEAPRKIIQALPGVELIELPRNREKCICCGGGGNLEMTAADLSSKIAQQKIDEILSTGASTVVTACQQCVRTMNTYAKRNKIPLDVMDITQLVENCLADENKAAS
ncbi:MAG: (Fe-S)-binding protein [Desulfobacteraceae bacterium]|nr:(Fe-S)-binding protein [Desulfobacteraceae bacterium]